MYSNTIQDFSLIKNEYSVTNDDLENSLCECNLSSNSCDYNCCCDLDCPVSLLKKWIIEENNNCIDKINYKKQAFTACFDINLIVYFNLKRGMRDYKLGEFFCSSFDNSSLKNKYYSKLRELTEDEKNILFKSFKDTFKMLYGLDYYRDNNILYNKSTSSYKVNDPIFIYKFDFINKKYDFNDIFGNSNYFNIITNSNNTNITSIDDKAVIYYNNIKTFDISIVQYLIYNVNKLYYKKDSDISLSNNFNTKFYLYTNDINNRCARTHEVKFLNDVKYQICNFYIPVLNACEKYDWRKLSLFDYMFASNNAKSNDNFISPKILRLFIRNSKTNEINLVEKFNVIEDLYTKLSVSDDNCICNNLLNEIHYKVLTLKYSFIITEVYLDIVLLDNYEDKCNKPASLKLKTSLTFSSTLSDYVVENNPGYSFNSNLVFSILNTDNNSIDVIKNNSILNISKKIKIKNNYINSCQKKIIRKYSKIGTTSIIPVVKTYIGILDKIKDNIDQSISLEESSQSLNKENNFSNNENLLESETIDNSNVINNTTNTNTNNTNRYIQEVESSSIPNTNFVVINASDNNEDNSIVESSSTSLDNKLNVDKLEENTVEEPVEFEYKKIRIEEQKNLELNFFASKDTYANENHEFSNIKFGRNMDLSCKLITNINKATLTSGSSIKFSSLSKEEFKEFCINKEWLELELFNLEFLTKGIIAKIANSSPKHLNDWVKIIKNKYLPNSSKYTELNSTCSIPTIVNLIILYDTIGSPEDPSYYILGANLETINVDIKYENLIKSNSSQDNINTNLLDIINFKLSVKFVSASVNKNLNINTNRPSLFPQLPTDIFNPFIY